MENDEADDLLDVSRRLRHINDCVRRLRSRMDRDAIGSDEGKRRRGKREVQE